MDPLKHMPLAKAGLKDYHPHFPLSSESLDSEYGSLPLDCFVSFAGHTEQDRALVVDTNRR
jgi:hypothetical protein